MQTEGRNDSKLGKHLSLHATEWCSGLAHGNKSPSVYKGNCMVTLSYFSNTVGRSHTYFSFDKFCTYPFTRLFNFFMSLRKY